MSTTDELKKQIETLQDSYERGNKQLLILSANNTGEIAALLGEDLFDQYMQLTENHRQRHDQLLEILTAIAAEIRRLAAEYAEAYFAETREFAEAFVGDNHSVVIGKRFSWDDDALMGLVATRPELAAYREEKVTWNTGELLAAARMYPEILAAMTVNFYGQIREKRNGQ